MKLSLKLFRRIARLFSLKRREREEIEKKFHVELMARTHSMYNEYVCVQNELAQWQAVARMFRINNPYELYKALQCLQPDDYITEAQLKALEARCAAEFSRRSCAERLMKGVTDEKRNQDSV